MANNKHQQTIFNEIEAADYLRVSRQTLALARMKSPNRSVMPSPPYIKLGRSIRYLKADLDAWVNNHRVVRMGVKQSIEPRAVKPLGRPLKLSVSPPVKRKPKTVNYRLV